MRKTVKDFCTEAKINLDDVMKTYVSILRIMHGYIVKYGCVIDEELTVNRKILKEAVVDFYNDVARIKAFHVIDEPSIEKDNAYKAYWILRRKPIQVIKEIPYCEFINESFVTVYLTSVMSKEKGIDDAKKSKNPKWKNFNYLLFRNLKFRNITQQSLELMIEAFFCGCDFTA